MKKSEEYKKIPLDMSNSRIKIIGFVLLSLVYVVFVVVKYYSIVMVGVALSNASLVQAVVLWYVWGLLMILPLILLHVLFFRNLKATGVFLLGFPLIFVALAALITVLQPILYPSPDDVMQQTIKKEFEQTTTWNTLSSSRYRFSFQYPATWTFRDDWERTIAIANKFATRITLDEAVAQIEIYVLRNDEHVTSTFEQQPLKRAEELAEINKIEFINDNNQKGVRFIGQPTNNFVYTWNLGNGPHRAEIVQFQGSDYTFVIVAVYPSTNRYTPVFKQDLDHVISSFSTL